MRTFLIAVAMLIGLAGTAAAEDLLAVTPGTGGNIGGKLATGGGFHPGNLICDKTDPRICGTVNSDGTISMALPDGADVTLGTKADPATCATSNTLIACLRQLDADAIAGTSAPGTPATSAVTIQGNASGVAVPTADAAVLAAVSAAVPTGSNIIGRVGTDQTTPGTTDLVHAAQQGTWTADPTVCLPYHLANGTGASTNATNIKASAGQLCGLTLINTTTTIYYLKVYNVSGTPTCSSATGLVHVYPIPPAIAAGGAGGITRQNSSTESYTTGIAFCVTASGADTSNDSAAAGVYIEASYR